ncbi:MAG: septum formation initiator family protein [Candidatus Bipolaricaulota bacterium]
MNRLWRGGRRPDRRNPSVRITAVVLGVLVVGALGWLYGSKLAELISVSAEVAALQEKEAELLRQRAALRDRLESADDPAVVEAEARRRLGWGYEDEELVILLED